MVAKLNHHIGAHAGDAAANAFIAAAGWTVESGWMYDDTSSGKLKTWDDQQNAWLFFGGASGESGQETLWEWNGNDISQFDSPLSYGGGNGTLSVATYPAGLDVPRRNRLVYTHDGSPAVRAGRLYWINDLPTLPDAYVVEATLGPRNELTLGANTAPGVAVLGQDTAHFLLFGRGGAGFQDDLNLEITNGVTYDVGARWTTMLTGAMDRTDEGYRVRMLVDLRDPTGSTDPGISLYLLRPGMEAVTRASSVGWTGSGGSPPPDPSSSWDAGWQSGGTCKNVGLNFLHDATAAGSAYITDFRVLTV